MHHALFTFLLHAGNLQQQAAAAGALQALTYCPGRLDISAGIASEGGVPPLVTTGPLPLRSAAAGALCNLALASPHNQVCCCSLAPHLCVSCLAGQGVTQLFEGSACLL